MSNVSGSTALPAVMTTGTPSEVDAFLLASLWTGEAPSPNVQQVYDWIGCLSGRGDEFLSHISTCRYWLFDYYAKRAGIAPPPPIKRD